MLGHALKGVAGNLSAESLRDISAELERCGRSGQLDQTEQYMDQLHQEVGRCLAYLPQVEGFIRDSAKSE